MKEPLICAGLMLLLLSVTPVMADSGTKADPYQLNLTKGVTDISSQVYELHMLMFLICVAIAIVVFGVMFTSLYLHRKSRGAKPANFHESVKVEVAWTIVPFIILIFMAVPAARTLIAMEDNSEADMTVLITGSQWKWHYQYMEHELAFYSLLATPRAQINNKLAKGENYLLEVDRPGDPHRQESPFFGDL